jgi:hypothetical protein
MTEPEPSAPESPRADGEPPGEEGYLDAALPPQPIQIVAALARGAIIDPERPDDLPDPAFWADLVRGHEGISIRSPFSTWLTRAELQRLHTRARRNCPHVPLRNLLTYLQVLIPREAAAVGAVNPERVLALIRASGLADFAYIAEPPGDLPQITDPMFGQQAYLAPATAGGIDAPHAWPLPGGKGKGVGIVDVERGWVRAHPDLPNPPVAHLRGIDYSYKRHGNSVLGILVARHNTIGVAGIAPNATVRTVSVVEEGTYVLQPSAAITYAANRMAAGDVLLIEDQLGGVKPLELEPLSLTAIKTAVGNLLIVIEPAGNGGLPLDDQVTPDNQRILRRHSPSFVDSGSIMVGACVGPAPALAGEWSNFGSRVDCCASGDAVTTTDGAAPWYTHAFNGTSSASAIVAGAAAVIQGRVKALRRTPLRSRQMRWVLKTYSASIAAGQPAIGGIPDLGAVFTNKAWAHLPAPGNLVYT